jgi:hypothetical protein
MSDLQYDEPVKRGTDEKYMAQYLSMTERTAIKQLLNKFQGYAKSSYDCN